MNKREKKGEPARVEAAPSPGSLALRHPGVVLRDKEDLLKRLHRIEGQVRGVARLIEEDQYCVDILTQLAAVRAALNQVGLLLLESHVRGCVASAIQHQRGDPAIRELIEVIERFLR